jgi:hypothetical protein
MVIPHCAPGGDKMKNARNATDAQSDSEEETLYSNNSNNINTQSPWLQVAQDMALAAVIGVHPS